jgi:hypothetical protein
MRIAAFFISLLALLVFGLPFVAKGDGTVSGAVQSFMTYSLTAVSFLLALLTLFMSRSLSDELVFRQILILMAKPLPRWQFVVGKWVGIVGFNLALLGVSGVGIYGMTRYLAAFQPPRDEIDRQRLHNEVLTARHHAGFQAPVELFGRVANQEFERRKEEGLYADAAGLDPDKAIAELRSMVEIAWRNIGPGEFRRFEFTNVLCDRGPDSTIQIRYKCLASSYPSDEIIRTSWQIGNPEKVRPEVVRRRDIHDRYHTFSVRADTVAPDGTLDIFLANTNPYLGDPEYPNETEQTYVVRVDEKAGVEVLFSAGSFEGNLLRVLLLILFKLMFLAALGLAATSVFSFPVASLVSLTVYVLAAARRFIADALGYLGDEGAVKVFQTVFGLMLRVVLFVIPDFPAYDAVDVFVDGRNVTLMWVLQGFWLLALVQTGIVLALACLLFHRREVSEVSI